MVDKLIYKELSSDAYYLLTILMHLAANESNSSLSLRAESKFSKRRFDSAKAELIEKGYLETKQLYSNKYAFYIGRESVQRYKVLHKKSENRHEKNQIRKIKKSLDSSK